MDAAEIHISSMVVHARPEHLSSVKQGIESLTGSEIYGESACGKLVVVLESHTQEHITESIDRIAALDNVLSTALVYHQIESIEP